MAADGLLGSVTHGSQLPAAGRAGPHGLSWQTDWPTDCWPKAARHGLAAACRPDGLHDTCTIYTRQIQFNSSDPYSVTSLVSSAHHCHHEAVLLITVILSSLSLSSLSFCCRSTFLRTLARFASCWSEEHKSIKAQCCIRTNARKQSIDSYKRLG